MTTNDQGEHTPARNKHAITPERSFAWLVHRRPHLAGVGVMSKAAWMAVMSA